MMSTSTADTGTTGTRRFVGGVSHRGPVAGALGIGKVRLKFRPNNRNDPIRRLRYVIGFFLYSTFIGTMIFSYAWYHPNIRYHYLYPSLQRLYHVLDYGKYMLMLMLSYKSFLSLHNNNIRIDHNGVPTITADNTSHALFLQGYMHARGRLMQMEIYRRTALGTLSELYGVSALESDKLHRTLNIARIAEMDVLKLDREDYQYLVAYCNGVNQFITNEQWSLSLDFTLQLFGFSSTGMLSIRRWEPYHTLAIYRLIAYEWSSDWEEDLMMMLMRDISIDSNEKELWFSKNTKSIIIDKSNADGHSSSSEYVTSDGITMLPSIGGLAIAVSGNRTDSSTSASYLINSLTSKTSQHGLWFLSTLQLDGGWVSGGSIPGIPFVFIGRNRDVAWALTPSTMIDREDLFVYNEDEEVVVIDSTHDDDDDGGDGNRRSDGHRGGDERQVVFSCAVSGDCQERYEEINVRYETDVVRMHVVDTGHGPIINHLLHVELQSILHRSLAKQRINNIALSTQSLQRPIDLKFFRKINVASTFSDFQDATAHLQHLHVNALYSDVDGNIGSTITGRSPLMEASSSAESKCIHHNVDDDEDADDGRRRSVGTMDDDSCAGDAYTVYNPSSGLIVASDGYCWSRVHHPSNSNSSDGSPSQPPWLASLVASQDRISFQRLSSVMVDTYSPSSIALRLLIEEVVYHTLHTSSTLSSISYVDDKKNLVSMINDVKRIVDGFDGNYYSDGTAPVLLEAFRIMLVYNLVEPLSGLSQSLMTGNVIQSSSSGRASKHPLRLEIDWIRTHLLDGLIKNNSSINNTSARPSWLTSIRKYPYSFKYDRSYSVDRQHSTLRDLVLRASLVDAYEWCTKHFGTDSSLWRWDTAHAMELGHSNRKVYPVLDAMLALGPIRGSFGGLDSLLRSDYAGRSDLRFEDHGLSLRVSGGDDGGYSSSIRLAYPMIKSMDKRCYLGSVPSKQLQSTAGDRHVIDIYAELQHFWADRSRDRNQLVDMEVCLPELLDNNNNQANSYQASNNAAHEERKDEL